MTDPDLDPVPLPPAALSPRTGQATKIEQSRAVAQVQAAVLIARQYPRTVQTAVREMRRSCRQFVFAERAFYRYPRGDKKVTGPSIHFARELARTWGNVDYGVAELDRYDEEFRSEMLAFAWDLETNTRATTVFFVPHMRDKTDGLERLSAIRDIYENNANMGARRLRAMILSVMPPWFVEDAQGLCYETLKNGDGVPLPKRIANAIEKYDRLGVTVDELVRKVGRPTGRWTEHDVASLAVVFRSVERGEVSREDEFPAVDLITAEEIQTVAVAEPAPAAPDTGAGGAGGADSGAAEDPPAAEVRAWCKEQGITVPARGRLPDTAVAAYRAAHPTSGPATEEDIAAMNAEAAAEQADTE
jgi:hypothetical protein